jgi:substrate import-associated zinc metallohydrolase lipoprotein
MNKIIYISLGILILINVPACKRDETLPAGSQLDTTAQVHQGFDKWVYDNLTVPYNAEVRYRWNEWNMSDLGKYNYPTTAEHAFILMQLIKHTWIDSYHEVAGKQFLQHNFPRQFTLFGGVDRTPNGTPGAWGQASGGVNVLLFQANDLTKEKMNNPVSRGSYAGLMHHEFTHILNQNHPFDEQDFTKITAEGYSGQWQQFSAAESLRAGFVSSYARMNIMEDFAEMVKNLVTRTPAQWEAFISNEEIKYQQQLDQSLDKLINWEIARQEKKMQLVQLREKFVRLLKNAEKYPDRPSDKEVIDKYFADVFFDFYLSVYTDDFCKSVLNDVGAPISEAYLRLVNDDLYASPAQMKQLLRIGLDQLLPTYETAIAKPFDRTQLDPILEKRAEAQTGKAKIKEKEQFIVNYFKNVLQIDLYQLQAQTVKLINSPMPSVSTYAAPSTQASKSGKGLDSPLILDSRFYGCSWIKQGAESLKQN